MTHASIHCQFNIVQLNWGIKAATSHLPSKTDHCADITNGHWNDGAGVPVGAILPVGAGVSWIFAIKNHRFMVDIW